MSLILFVLILVSSALLISIEAVEYSKLYDTVDLDGILSNRRILDNYVNCFLDEGPCTKDARMFKADMPRGVINACKDCSQTQKNVIRKAGRFMRDKRPDQLQRILNRFDPEGKTTNKFYDFLKQDD